MSLKPWYARYEELRSEVAALRDEFRSRCVSLDLDPTKVLTEFTREILARAVQESNWQEGIELDAGRTQILADIAFDELEDVVGPHLDMNKILRFHRDAVLQLKRDGASHEELAAYNLARAHQAIEWVGLELAGRQTASLAQALRSFEGMFRELRGKIPAESRERIERGFAVLDSLQTNKTPIRVPMTAPPQDEGELLSELLKLESDHLLNPMRTAYVHFFHRLILMGIISPQKTGRFRSVPVHVSNPDLYFPVPSAVPRLMREYCLAFPTILPSTVNYDPILAAAKTSHRFVAIHPYVDGNGRVGRLLMNLVLWQHFPPVYLKADKKGRHRYSQALRRGDRGNYQPLAALIASSLIEIYERLLRSLGAQREGDGGKRAKG